MSGLSDLLVSVVRKKGRAHRVSLLLSGGVDSLSVGIALAEAGREVVAYTYELEGHPSLDRPKAERTAKHFGWPLRVAGCRHFQCGRTFSAWRSIMVAGKRSNSR